jgi:hypothetical protein
MLKTKSSSQPGSQLDALLLQDHFVLENYFLEKYQITLWKPSYIRFPHKIFGTFSKNLKNT